MKLVVCEKNNAAEKIANLLCDIGKAQKDKVYNTPVYRFSHEGDDWVTIGLRGHILAPDFPSELKFSDREGWFGLTQDGEHLPCDLPDGLARPPFKKKKPFLEDGVDIKGWKLPSLPYLAWAPIEKTPAEKEIIRALKNLAKKADSVIIATDFDREGELIGADALSQVQQVAPSIPVSRARYSALTKQEIEQAFSHLVELDQDLADAGESRQYIDLIWGACLTRYLTMAKRGGFGNVRSAGRVQTPTLALVVERERERMAFVPEDYWLCRGLASQNEDAGEESCFKIAHVDGRIFDKAQAHDIYEQVKDAKQAQVVAVNKKTRQQKPPAPFNTTSLQAAAAAEGITPARCMRLAESLYMDGLISYPRVDNTVYPASLDLAQTCKMLSGVPQYAQACKEILSYPEIRPTRGKQQTTDHPPIHPTGVADPSKLQPAAWKLYNLIARRFLATLMGPATIEGTKLTFDVCGQNFQAQGDVLVHAGFRSIYKFGLKKDEQLPQLNEGDAVYIAKLDLEAKQTEPPARYSQGRLVQEMEKRGLGTKSTRASIIERLMNVKYLKNDPIEPSQLGMAIIDALDTYAPHITTPDMTAALESDMTQVAEGKKTQESVVDASRTMLAGILDELIEHTEDLGDSIADAVTADAKVGVCPKCGRDLVVKNSAKTRGSFIGCMGWPDCDVTYPLPKGKIEPLETVCSECGAPRIKVKPFRSKAYEMCVNPKCPTNYEEDLSVGNCPVCAEAGKTAQLIAHKSETTGKRFIRCENYDNCGVSYPLPQRGTLHATGETCPDCDAPIVEIETDRGPWRICVNMDCPSKEKKTYTRRGTKKKASKKKAKK